MKRFFALLLSLLVASPAFATTPVCFAPSDLAHVTPSGARVFQPSPCPASDTSATYKYWPVTHCASFDMTANLASTATTVSAVASLWANRWDGGTTTHKPNPAAGPDVYVDDGTHGSHPCYLDYTTLKRAQAADASEASWLFGYAPHVTGGIGWLDSTERSDVRIPDVNNITQSAFAATASTICTGWDATDNLYFVSDFVVRPNVRLVDLPSNLRPWGIKYDYESHDGRATTKTNVLVGAIVDAGAAAGFGVDFYVNPLDGGQVSSSGVTSANIDYLAGKVAIFSLIVSHAPAGGVTMQQSLANQIAMFSTAPNLANFNYVIDPAMTPTQARDMKALLGTSYAFGGYDDWPDGLAAGGSCTSNYNQVLAIMYGE